MLIAAVEPNNCGVWRNPQCGVGNYTTWTIPGLLAHVSPSTTTNKLPRFSNATAFTGRARDGLGSDRDVRA
jgi:hypothetical protein